MSGSTVRRPIKARGSRWAAATALRLARAGVRPNQISVLSVVFAVISGVCLAVSRDGAVEARVILLLAAAACIPLRLLCNLFDGMVAVECGLGTKSGAVYNELPDRISDLLVLAGAGYSIAWVEGGPELGWAAAALAILTAYVRTLGAASGASQDFRGPMAKQQRMAIVGAACLLTAVEILLGAAERVMTIALWLIVVGCVVTCVRRLLGILRELEAE